MAEIRRQNRADSVEAIARVYVKGWQNAYRGLLPDAALDGLTTARWTTRLAVGGRITSLVAVEAGGGIVGTSSFCAARDERMRGWGEIVSLYLLPEYAGRGLGRGLLEAASSALRAAGFGDIYLWVLEGNANARAFYEHCGFRPDGGAQDDTIGDGDVRELRYVLRAGNEIRRRMDGESQEET